jgi:hypothetical protein
VARFLVFARTAFEDPLSLAGEVTAADAAAARDAALGSYGEDWVELDLIPHDAVRWILGPSPPQTGAGA